MIATTLAALTLLAAAPTLPQAAIQQSPPANAVRKLPLVASNDIHVMRQTPDVEAQPIPKGMVLIPGGRTLVGTDPSKIPEYGQNNPDQMREVAGETPRHSVDVATFLIDITEVTNLQWRVFLDTTHRKPSPTLVEFGWPDGQIPAGQEYFPITNVNFPEMREYLVWCGKRLPTEAEWTRAARGDDDRTYPWAGKWVTENCLSAQSPAPISGPVAVGSCPGGASPYGVMDMVGNVFEWVDSPFKPFEGFKAYDYKQGKKTIQLSPDFNSTEKVIKGGGFQSVRLNARIDTRLAKAPDASLDIIGFRAARSEKPGLEVIRHAVQRLLPAQFSKPGSLDELDIMAQEDESYDESLRVITGYRYLAFAHRGPARLGALSAIRSDARDNPLPLGVLATSEPLLMPDMKPHGEGTPAMLPPGEYTLAFKSEGESKKYKEQRRLERTKGKSKDEPKAAPEAPVTRGGESPSDIAGGDAPADASAGAAAPWPGIGSVHDIEEDVDFPQDIDVVLYYNANNAVVGWAKSGDIRDAELQPVTSVGSNDGRTWTVEFSVDTQSKRNPRFTLPIHLGGAGFQKK